MYNVRLSRIFTMNLSCTTYILIKIEKKFKKEYSLSNTSEHPVFDLGWDIKIKQMVGMQNGFDT
jgi:hypothetical protein